MAVVIAPAKEPRSDLAAYRHAIRLALPKVVEELVGLLGPKLVAYIAGVGETRAVNEWANGERAPRAPLSNRLRMALRLALMISSIEGRNTPLLQAWFLGLNPELDDRSPARMLREGDLDEIGPVVVGAARTFMAEG
jgi:hypothetical protein